MVHSLSHDYLAWRGKIDMTVSDLEKEVAALKGDVALLKTSLAGFTISLEAQADQLSGLLDAVNQIEGGSGGDGGLNAVVEKLGDIAKALESGVPQTNAPPLQVTALQPRETVPRKTQPKKAVKNAVRVDLDVADIEWQIKGGSEARDTDPFAYAFIFTSRDSGEVKDAVVDIYDACTEHGIIETSDGFIVNLGGTNQSLLNRKPAKKSRR
jgi:hypothetical protein